MKRVKLTAKPVSKNWSMEKQGQHYDKKLAPRNPTCTPQHYYTDIEELMFLLSDDGCSPVSCIVFYYNFQLTLNML